MIDRIKEVGIRVLNDAEKFVDFTENRKKLYSIRVFHFKLEIYFGKYNAIDDIIF